jgi:catechol 2,3-dioxygenase-like lactoylglutathione lyase family enzyme
MIIGDWPLQTVEVCCEPIENRTMKTRCFDHIDLRVKDMEVARKFYREFLPQVGFVHESPGENFHTFYAAGGDRPSEFFGFTQNNIINRTAHESRFGPIPGRK